MPQYTAENVVVRPGRSADPAVIVEVTPALAQWEHINFQVRQLAAGAQWSWQTGEHELALVTLGGTLAVHSDRGTWPTVGGRTTVFDGLPHALYLPRRTALSITASSAATFALAWVRTDQDHPPQLVTPERVPVEVRGGDHATRQINGIIPPGFACDKLVVVEVYTPGGNWSSYPPHKHDVHRLAADGGVLEADLEEIYYYQFDRPEGFALQRVYTDASSPLALAGQGFDLLLTPRQHDAVLVPEGYHPVSSPPGYTTYYLNILAGSAQSLANVEDPQFAWVRGSYQGLDPRLPVYPLPGR